jgi:hypothetical protein
MVKKTNELSRNKGINSGFLGLFIMLSFTLRRAFKVKHDRIPDKIVMKKNHSQGNIGFFQPLSA